MSLQKRNRWIPLTLLPIAMAVIVLIWRIAAPPQTSDQPKLDTNETLVRMLNDCPNRSRQQRKKRVPH
jgi:hypothetical protein